jgi:hypothetical protein
LPEDPRTPTERALNINEQCPNRLRRQLRAHFPHVLVWLSTADDPRGSLAREFTRDDARTASDINAVASRHPIDGAQLLARISTGRLDVDDAAISLSDASAPARVRVGQPFAAEVTLSNHSPATLSSFPPFPVRFAYLWFDERGASAGGNHGRSLIAPAAGPNEQRRYQVRVVAPEHGGRYTLRLTLVQEFVRWFGAYADATVDAFDEP